jgi:hypothetical protein
LETVRDLLRDAIKGGKPKVPEALLIADEAGRRTLEVVPFAAVLPQSLRK